MALKILCDQCGKEADYFPGYVTVEFSGSEPKKVVGNYDTKKRYLCAECGGQLIRSIESQAVVNGIGA